MGKNIHNTLAEIDSHLKATPYPEPNQIVYSTTDGEPIELTDSNIVSNVYYKDKGFGILTYKNNIPSLSLYGVSNKEKVTEVKVPYGPTAFGDNCFNGFINLKRVNIPESVTYLSTNSFYDCRSLEEIKFPSSVTSIGYGAFRKCNSIQFIIIPDSITSIADANFTECSSLRSIVFNANVEKAPAFSNNKELREIIWGEGIKITGGATGCPKLEKVVFPSSTERIGSFRGGGSMIKELIIPSNVTSVEDYYSLNGWNLDSLIIKTSSLIFPQYCFLTASAKFIDSSLQNITNFPAVTESIILRANIVIEALDSYLKNPAARLKVYVPANLLKQYKETYPTLARHFHPITGEDTYVLKDDLDEYVTLSDLKELFPDLAEQLQTRVTERITARKMSEQMAAEEAQLEYERQLEAQKEAELESAGKLEQGSLDVIGKETQNKEDMQNVDNQSSKMGGVIKDPSILYLMFGEPLTAGKEVVA